MQRPPTRILVQEHPHHLQVHLRKAVDLTCMHPHKALQASHRRGEEMLLALLVFQVLQIYSLAKLVLARLVGFLEQHQVKLQVVQAQRPRRRAINCNSHSKKCMICIGARLVRSNGSVGFAPSAHHFVLQFNQMFYQMNYAHNTRIKMCTTSVPPNSCT